MTLIQKFVAQQVGNPSGIFGYFISTRLLNRRNKTLNDIAFDNLALTSQDRVLEIGFGGGYLLDLMSKIVTDGFLAGVDFSSAMVEYCEKHFRLQIQSGKMELQCATAELLPFPAHHFTEVVTVNSIFYWQDAPRALAEIARVLGANGLLVIVMTCKESIQDRALTPHGIMMYEENEVRQLIESAGFIDVCINHASDKHRKFLCIQGRKPQ